MTGNKNSAFSVTIFRNNVTVKNVKNTIVYSSNVKQWDAFRSAVNSVGEEVNSFLTEEVKSKTMRHFCSFTMLLLF